MKRQERKELVKSINQKMTDLNDLRLSCKNYNGFNYGGRLFDFEYIHYIMMNGSKK